MDYEKAVQYAYTRLRDELPPKLYYHGVHHTADDVVPAAARLAAAHNLNQTDRILVLTSAWYHDLGFIEQYEANEPIGVRIARDALPNFGYSPAHIETISGIIMATRWPQSPNTLLEKIMADADLDSLGRLDFMSVAQTLREEEVHWRGKTLTDAQWYWVEMRFLAQHRYFTKPQRAVRNNTKVQNFLQLARLFQANPPAPK